MDLSILKINFQRAFASVCLCQEENVMFCVWGGVGGDKGVWVKKGISRANFKYT